MPGAEQRRERGGRWRRRGLVQLIAPVVTNWGTSVIDGGAGGTVGALGSVTSVTRSAGGGGGGSAGSGGVGGTVSATGDPLAGGSGNSGWVNVRALPPEIIL